MLKRLAATGAPLGTVAAVSGSGQQHGSAYWAAGGEAALRGLSGGKGAPPLSAQLAKAFRVADSPIWMDSSTAAECALLEKGVGGAAALAHLTGSRAYERFTGSQILALARRDPAAYAETERISLVSGGGVCSMRQRACVCCTPPAPTPPSPSPPRRADLLADVLAAAGQVRADRRV